MLAIAKSREGVIGDRGGDVVGEVGGVVAVGESEVEAERAR